MIASQSVAPPGQLLSEGQIIKTLHEGLAGQFRDQRVLVLIPDHTRSLPLPFLFHAIVEALHNVRQLDFMVALGTHPPLSEERINALVGVTPDERRTTFKHIGLSNHAWNTPAALTSLGAIGQDELKQIAGGYWHSSLPSEVDIRINRAALEHEQIGRAHV